MKVNIRTTLLSLLLLAAVISVVFQHRSISAMRAENQALSGQLAALSESSEPVGAVENTRNVNEEALRLRAANRDLPKLRNEVYQLRKQTSELTALRSENERRRASQPGLTAKPLPAAAQPAIPFEQLQFAGFATPEATLQTLYWAWAMKQGDFDSAARCQSPEFAQNDSMWKSRENFRSSADRMLQTFKGLRVVARKVVSPEITHLGVQMFLHEKDEPQETALPFQLIDGEWKLSPPR